MRHLVLVGCVCWSVLVLVGCGDDDGGGSVGRGSAACQDWQDSLCDFVSDRCGGLSRAQCDEQYQGVTCLSDSAASACSNAFNAASCASGPPDCDLSDIADPAPAQQACRDLMDRTCDRIRVCDPTTPPDCAAMIMAEGIDCTRAIAFTLNYEACLAEIDNLSCTTQALPDSCDGAIKVRAAPAP